MLVQSNKSELNVLRSQKADEWAMTDILKSCLKCKYWYFSHFFSLCKSRLNKASGRREHIFAFQLILEWSKPNLREYLQAATNIGDCRQLGTHKKDLPSWWKLSLKVIYIQVCTNSSEIFFPKNASHTIFSWDETADVPFEESRNSCSQKAL